MDKIIALIKEFIENRLYGKIEITFESGKVVNMKKTESINVAEIERENIKSLEQKRGPWKVGR